MRSAGLPIAVTTERQKIAPYVDVFQTFGTGFLDVVADAPNGEFVYPGEGLTNIGVNVTASFQLDISDLTQNNQVFLWLTDGNTSVLIDSMFKSSPLEDIVTLAGTVPFFFPSGNSIWLEINASKAFDVAYLQSVFTSQYIYGSDL